mgnify:CR=1 FL=1
MKKSIRNACITLGLALATAVASTLMLAVNCVGPATVTLLTVTPSPKDTCVVPAAKCVLLPTTVTVALAPCAAAAGETEAIAAGAETRARSSRVLLPVCQTAVWLTATPPTWKVIVCPSAPPSTAGVVAGSSPLTLSR